MKFYFYCMTFFIFELNLTVNADQHADFIKENCKTADNPEVCKRNMEKAYEDQDFTSIQTVCTEIMEKARKKRFTPREIEDQQREQCVTQIKKAYTTILSKCSDSPETKDSLCELWHKCHNQSLDCPSAIRSKIKGIDSMTMSINNIFTENIKTKSGKPNTPFTNNHLIGSIFKSKMKLCAKRGTQRGDRCLEEKAGWF